MGQGLSLLVTALQITNCMPRAGPFTRRQHKLCAMLDIGREPCAGIIIGMLLFGAVGDLMGRRLGSICTACTMLLGAAMLTAQDGATPKGFTVFYIISQFVFGWASPPRRRRTSVWGPPHGPCCRGLACRALPGRRQPSAVWVHGEKGAPPCASAHMMTPCRAYCKALAPCMCSDPSVISGALTCMGLLPELSRKSPIWLRL